ncbi:MAG: hypothetical protein RJA70_4600, partial [Pseudomonadota bacterium]
MDRSENPSAMQARLRCVFPAIRASVVFGSLLVASAAAAAPGDLGTLFQVNDEDPTKNIPTLEQRNTHPLEFGYYLQDLVARGQVPY